MLLTFCSLRRVINAVKEKANAIDNSQQMHICIFLITYSSIADLGSLADCQLKEIFIPGTFINDIVKNA